MTMFPRNWVLLLLLIAAETGTPAPAATQGKGWTYREVPHGSFKTVEAIIPSDDGHSVLAVNCSFAAEPTVSIQYRPDSTVVLAMAPILLDWAIPKGAALGAKLIWEPASGGAFVRDGVDDRNVSEVAEIIKVTPGSLKLTAMDAFGKPVETLYTSVRNLDAITRVLAQCPWKPQPKAADH